MQTTLNITLNRILTSLAEHHASDLHLTVGAHPILRLNGELISMNDEEVITADFINGVIDKLLSDEQKKIWDKEKEIIFVYQFGDRARFRVDLFWQKGFPSVVFHYIAMRVKSLAELDMPRQVAKLAEERSGLIIVGGPYRGGKTTTMIGFLETINRTQKRHILTLEQPIEHILVSNKSLVEQKEVGVDSDNWQKALDIREEDVDVLMVTHTKNENIIPRLIEISGSGILVFMPMEGNSITQVLRNIIDVCPHDKREYYRFLLSKTFRGAIIKKLLPKIGGGLVPAMEIAFASQTIISSIKDNKFDQLSTILMSGREQGMISLDRYLMELVKSGQVSKEVAIKEANNPEELKRLLAI